MEKLKLIDFNDWIKVDDSYGSGASEKIILQDTNTGKKGIFKFPKKHSNGEITGEYWAESLAYEIATIIEIPCAKIDMGIYRGRRGSMSYIFLKQDDVLIEGVHFISAKYPNYNRDILKDEDVDLWYSIEMVRNSISSIFFNDFLEILIFDALIGNSDRHHSNWGISLMKKDHISMLSNLYDNGSSLCCTITDDKINMKDKNWCNAITNTKSKSLIRIRNEKRKPTQ